MEEEAGKAKWRLLVGLLVMALLVGTLWIVNSRPVPEAEVELASVTTSEGFRLVVHRAEVGKRMTIRGPEAKWSLSKLASVGSGNTWGFGTSDLEMKIKNGRFESASFIRETSTLMLLVRVWDHAGDVVSTDEVEMFGGWQEGGQIGRDDFGFYAAIDRSRWPSPPWRIEIGDGAGGLIPTRGPLIPVDWDGRAFHMCPCFPRTVPELDVRVRFEGDENGYAMKVPNPGYSKSFPSWAADPKPWKKVLGDVAVEIDSIGRIEFGEPFPEVEPICLPLIDQAPDAWEISAVAVSDRFGNHVDRYWEFIRLPGVDLVRYEFEIKRGDKFRWPINECSVIGELVWPADTAVEKEVVATISADGKALGVNSLNLARSAGKPFRFQELDKWRISWSAEAPDERLAPGRENPFVLVLGEDEKSSGAVDSFFEGQWSTSSSFEIEGSYYWAGKIEPGQRVRIVLPKYRPPRPFSFTFSTKDLDRALAEEE